MATLAFNMITYIDSSFPGLRPSDPDWLKELIAEATDEVQRNIVPNNYIAVDEYVVWAEVWKKYTSNAVSAAKSTAAMQIY